MEAYFFGARCILNIFINALSCSTVAAKHKETKQFFTMYNTLEDTKVYLEKEVSMTFMNAALLLLCHNI